MNDNIIYGGAFQLARQIFSSEVWLEKPATWKVIWIYILGKVNHKDNGKFKRGEGFFNLTREREQIGIDISYNVIREAMRYFRKSKMIDTTKTTRGVIIKVIKYNEYQTLDNFQNTTENKVKTKPKHNENTMINKNVKNEKNEKNTILRIEQSYGNEDINSLLKDFEDIMKFKSSSSKDRIFGKHLTNNFTGEQLKTMLTYCSTDSYAPRIGSLEKMWYKRGDIIAGLKAKQNKMPTNLDNIK